jgi:toxin CptA
LSSESSSFHIDWRPSQVLCACYAGLGVLAAISIGISALPPAFAAALALLPLAHGLRLARAEWRRPALAIEFGRGMEPPMIRADAVRAPLHDASLSVRGPFTMLAWRDADGARRSLSWFADTLPASSRRRLRLQFSAASADGRA